MPISVMVKFPKLKKALFPLSKRPNIMIFGNYESGIYVLPITAL